MKRSFLYLAASTFLLLGWAACQSSPSADASAEAAAASESEPLDSHEDKSSDQALASPIEALPDRATTAGQAIATFAGGCFWCMEPPFDELDGVSQTIVGYTGGAQRHPTYKQVAAGQTDHAEAIRVYYDPDKITYERLLEVFWRNIDPTQEDGQFIDRGTQYRSAIFYHDERQKKLAEASRDELAGAGVFDEPIVTAIEPAQTFWKAEAYHQDFYKKDPVRYKSYRRGSGRDSFIEQTWGDSH